MNKCGDCIHFEKCKAYTDPNETYPEVGGCKNFKNKMPNNLTDAEIERMAPFVCCPMCDEDKCVGRNCAEIQNYVKRKKEERDKDDRCGD